MELIVIKKIKMEKHQCLLQVDEQYMGMKELNYLSKITGYKGYYLQKKQFYNIDYHELQPLSLMLKSLQFTIENFKK